MRMWKRSVAAGFIVLLAAPGMPPANGQGVSGLGNILQSELKRNFERLSREAVPPYFISYTVHDLRNTTIQASFGALQRSDQNQTRFGTVEVRAGDLSAWA